MCVRIRYSGTSAGRITTVFLNSPQMELILAVGRKLSTKSDIRLPNSWRREINNVKACIDLLTISSVKVCGVRPIPSVRAVPLDKASGSQSRRNKQVGDMRSCPGYTPPPSVGSNTHTHTINYNYSIHSYKYITGCT